MSEIVITEPGIYDMSEEVYHADPCKPASCSSSQARAILPPNGCPAKVWYQRQHPPEPTKAFDFGKAAHRWVIEPDTWRDTVEVLPRDFDARRKADKALVKEIEDEGLQPLRAADFETIKGMRDALLGHKFAHAAFEDVRVEKSLFWRDPEFGIWCRTRPDALPNRHAIVGEYKTTLSAEPDYLRRKIFEYGYYQRADWYLSGIRELGLIDEPRFLFVFQEKTPPYLITCVTPTQIALEWAEIQNRKAREVFARCLDTGVWPEYADNILTLDLPVWAEHRLMDQHDRGDFQTEGETE